jgi:hypothetical protein
MRVKRRIKMNSTVKTILKIFSGLLILSGGIWILQGVNILPGSFMTGDPQWAYSGLQIANKSFDRRMI